MTENEMRQFVECGLVGKHEYELFTSIAKDVDYDNEEARKFAVLTFFYLTGSLSEKEYKNNEIYKNAKKAGWV